MADALYGPEGFYRRELPAAHFRTSTHVGTELADAIARLAVDVEQQLGEDLELTLLDMGAGAGELLTALTGRLPERWRLVGCELRPPPVGLDPRIAWVASPPTEVHGVVIAHEWLDNVPVDVAVFSEGTWREVCVQVDGEESIGDAVSGDGLDWLQHWWPSPREGDRAEIGVSRDVAWAEVVGVLASGIALAVDYGTEPRIHRFGTLAGYRGGRLVPPIPDGSCDLTAHVQFDAVAVAGEVAGADATLVLTQRQALQALGVSGRRPDLALASSDPAEYVRQLASSTRAAELVAEGGLGEFTWLLQSRGVAIPEAFTAATG